MLTTIPVTVTLLTSSGAAIVGARVTATLTQMDTAALYGLVFPREVSATSNHDGEAVLHLWPNTAGVTGSQYRFRATDPASGRKLIDQVTTVPEHPVNLRDILMLPAPTKKPYDEASITAIQQARSEAVAAANEASGYLGTVQQDAQLATQKASEAGSHAQTATEQAEAAGLSNQQAGQAATLAGQKAALAAQHEANANEAADAAEEDAQIATSKAQQAGGSAVAAGQSAQQAQTAAQQAAVARQGVENLRDQTGQLAHKASIASNTAQAALTRANQEADKAGLRASHAMNYRDSAHQAKIDARSHRESARRWAQEHEGTPVINEDGEVPQYSAMHWALHALRYALGGGIDDTKATVENVWTAFKTKERIEQERDRALVAELLLQDQLDDKVDKIDGFGLSQANYTPAEKEKLAGLESSRFKGQFTSLAALEAAFQAGEAGDYANVDMGVGNDVVRYIWDTSDEIWVEQLGISSQLTGAQIKQEYEAQPDTNAFTDADRIKLDGIQAEATKNATNAQLRDRATHTGEQAINTVTGLREELDSKVDKVFGKQLSSENFTTPLKEKLQGIEPEANNYQHPATHPASMIETSDVRQFASQSEKDAWNAKETPEGAQQKATQAKDDAKEYADQTFIEKTKRGTPNGVASLDSLGRVPQSQLPPTEATQAKSNAVAMAIVFGA